MSLKYLKITCWVHITIKTNLMDCAFLTNSVLLYFICFIGISMKMAIMENYSVCVCLFYHSNMFQAFSPNVTELADKIFRHPAYQTEKNKRQIKL